MAKVRKVLVIDIEYNDTNVITDPHEWNSAKAICAFVVSSGPKGVVHCCTSYDYEVLVHGQEEKQSNQGATAPFTHQERESMARIIKRQQEDLVRLRSGRALDFRDGALPTIGSAEWRAAYGNFGVSVPGNSGGDDTRVSHVFGLDAIPKI